MVRSTNLFIDALEKWLQAVRADDFETARFHAKNIVMNGQMLVIHPDFLACFKKHHANVQPVDVLLGLCQFLMCATDGRAVVLKAACKTLAKPPDGHDGSR